ncbi:MAG: hypothetical protein WCO56_02630 [Verrucomicrobiota bacterium]
MNPEPSRTPRTFAKLGSIIIGLYSVFSLMFIILAEKGVLPGDAGLAASVLLATPVLLSGLLFFLWLDCGPSRSSALWLILLLAGVALLVFLNYRWMYRVFSAI